MSREVLIIASKYPQPGEVKTRLADEVGIQNATNIARAMLLDLVSEHQNQRYDLVIETNNSSSVEGLLELCGDVEVRAGMSSFLRGPKSNTFNVFSYYFRDYDKVMMITGDTPGIDRNVVNGCLNELDRHDVVVGPDYDGGYYLLGMRCQVDLFSQLPETRSPYLFPTAVLAIKNNLTLAIERPLRDIDRLGDIKLIDWDNMAVKWYRTNEIVKHFLD